MKNIVILISGGGSNMAAIVRMSKQDHWDARHDARVAAVISNRPDAAGLAVARSLGVATAVVSHKDFDSREHFDAALAEAVDSFSPTLVVLAGFLRILTPPFVSRYERRLLNVHPSLLPAFPGLDTHRRAIEGGCRVAGATVHLVTTDLDHGPILAQAAVPVMPGDTPELLAARVLAQEHRLYPKAIADWLARSARRVD